MLVFYLAFFIVCLAICNLELNAVPLQRIELQTKLNNTRRIMGGKEAGDTRPYMVYLRAAPPAPGTKPKKSYSDWLCGGAIIHERYILTSAACIEDVQQFYVVSGTHKWIPGNENNPCITNGAKKAVWKCVPKSYVFDGKEFENVLWMANDIAVVKVENDFNFKRRIRGCDFVPQKIGFNNISEELEKAGTTGSIAGWGSIDKFSNDDADSKGRQQESTNSPSLLETEVVLLSKKNCKKRWDPRYHHIIDGHMICAKDGSDAHAMSEQCQEQGINCKELAYSDEENDDDTGRRILEPSSLVLHEPKHINDTRRAGSPVGIGGFCENDHGGPLVVGQGKSAIVIGVISACMTKEISKKCYGPYLYTSVWKNRQLINCAIDKDIGTTCKMLLRAGKTHFMETMYNWDYPNQLRSEMRVKPVKNVSSSLLNTNGPAKRSRSAKKSRRSHRRMLEETLKKELERT